LALFYDRMSETLKNIKAKLAVRRGRKATGLF
jgi:hypothetical protein